MGNHGEVFRTADGSLFQVSYSYEYLYAYYPEVTICAGRGKLLIEGKTIDIVPVRSAAPSTSTKSGKPRTSDAPNTVVLRVRGCDYFLADGPRGLYLLEWYGGYDPDRGDGIFGEVDGYGFKDVLYANGREGRLYVDDYLLSKDNALEKLREKCR
jgi:hypothetical protein